MNQREIKFKRAFFFDEQHKQFSHFQEWGFNTGKFKAQFTGPGENNKAVYTIDLQYTGQETVNGQQVYEGEKVKFCVFDAFSHEKHREGFIVYSGSRFMIWKTPDSEFYGSDGGYDLDVQIQMDDEFEVIGNIYENPELLK